MAAKKKRGSARRVRRPLSQKIVRAILADPSVAEEVAWWASAQLLCVRVNVGEQDVEAVAHLAGPDLHRSLSLYNLIRGPFEGFHQEIDVRPLRQQTGLQTWRLGRAVDESLASATQKDRHRLFADVAAALGVAPTTDEDVDKTVRLWALKRLLEQLRDDLEEDDLVHMFREAWIDKDVMST